MDYRPSEMKIDQFVAYLNEEKINFSPPFQRGHVWLPGVRKKLLKNVLQGKPIPAVFLYKEASGSKYSYNILDGKQRLESIILFIGNKNPALSIPKWHKYLFGEGYKKHVNFKVDLPDGKKAFADLGDDKIRDFREYTISTIEINLGDDTLDEIISLFVDINQQGSPVSRFDIVKALNRNDSLLRSIFELLSVEQKRGQDIFYRMIRNEFTGILKLLKIVNSAPVANAKVDRMWERLLELVSFYRSKIHRKPVDILKAFMSATKATPTKKLTVKEIRGLRIIFRFLLESYKKTSLGNSRLATDQTYFYTMLTTIIKNNLVEIMDEEMLRKKLATLGEILDGLKAPKKTLRATVKQFQEETKKQTTDPPRRVERDRLFLKLLHAV